MGDPSFGPATDTLADPVAVLVAYLAATPSVVALVDDRISSTLDADTAWPAVRVTLIAAYPVYPRVLDRLMVQLDCFSDDEPQAYAVAASVRAALVGCGGWVGDGAVLSGSTGLGLQPIPDQTFTPPASRVAVIGYVFARNGEPAPPSTKE